jgi:hypothetical protein
MGRVVSQPSQQAVTRAYQRPSVIDDVTYVADGMRRPDVEEVMAQSGLTPHQSLLYSFFMSKPCMTIVGRHGRAIGMWGVVPDGSTAGRIWMLGRCEMLTDVADKWEFLRQSRIHLADLQSKYPVLFNFVDARNTVHLRWLRWMGFTFINQHDDFGPQQRTFYEFVRI